MMTSHRYEHLAAYVLEHPWAVTQNMLATIADIVGERLAGMRRSDEQLAAAVATRSIPRVPSPMPVGVLPIHGVIAPRMNLLSEMSGGATYDQLTNDLRALRDDGDVRAILLDYDSPGGSVAGAHEFAAEVRRAAAVKPVFAQAEYLMASAAYWTGSGATEIVAAPSAMIGSVGVYTIHNDLSAALAKLGVKRTYIAAGKYKVAGNETEALAPEIQARIQQKVDEARDRFVADVAAGRSISVQAVRSGYGEGDTVSATEALRLGMIDSISTLDETLARLIAAPEVLLQAKRDALARARLAPYQARLTAVALASHRRALAAMSHRVNHVR